MAYITNRSVRRDYEVYETVRAGLSLTGTETKSIRTGRGSLAGARVLVRDGDAYLVGAHIPPHQEKNAPVGYDPERTRRLLLHRKELEKLSRETEAKNLTLVPLSVYNCSRKLKLDIGIAVKGAVVISGRF